jgi:hypothetical protein
MKTNCANNRCAEVHSSACVKYTGSGSASLGIYCDDALNPVLDALIAKVEELEAKVADTCRLSIAGVRISLRDSTSNLPTQMVVKLDNVDNRFTPILYRVNTNGTEFPVNITYNTVTSSITIESLNGFNQSEFLRVEQGTCTAEFIMPNLGANQNDQPYNSTLT